MLRVLLVIGFGIWIACCAQSVGAQAYQHPPKKNLIHPSRFDSDKDQNAWLLLITTLPNYHQSSSTQVDQANNGDHYPNNQTPVLVESIPFTGINIQPVNAQGFFIDSLTDKINDLPPHKYTPLIVQYDWDHEVAFAIMMAESGGKPRVKYMLDEHYNCRGSYGLFQIACFWPRDLDNRSIEDLYDPEYNVSLAYRIYKIAGDSWTPWGAYINKSYLKFLN